MCFTSVVRRHQRLFKAASRCEEMRLTAMSLKLELVDRPCAFWDVTTAEWVPTHQRMCTNHIMSYLWAAALIYTSVVCLFWRTVKGESRPPHRHCVVFLCATPDSSGFRVARSGKEEGKSWLYQGMGNMVKKLKNNSKKLQMPNHFLGHNMALLTRPRLRRWKRENLFWPPHYKSVVIISSGWVFWQASTLNALSLG